MHFFITGTDTGVGKTYVTVRLVQALRTRGVDAVGFKPICCGGRDDAETLHAASAGALTLNEVDQALIDLDLVRETFLCLRARHSAVLVEGVGGWLVPIRHDYTAADLAREWQLPVIIVVKNVLGALNHTALTVQAVREAGLPCAELVLNHPPPSDAAADDGVQALAPCHQLRGADGMVGCPDLGGTPSEPKRIVSRSVKNAFFVAIIYSFVII